MKKPITDSLVRLYSLHYSSQSIFNGGKQIIKPENYKECSAVWLQAWLKNFGFYSQDERIFKL